MGRHADRRGNGCQSAGAHAVPAMSPMRRSAGRLEDRPARRCAARIQCIRFRMDSHSYVRVMTQATTRTSSHYLRVGDLARQTGKSVRAIRLYGEMGLLEPATRSSGGFRLYHPEAVERVRWIDLLNGLGISLHEAVEALNRWWQSDRGPEAMDDLRALFTAKLEETRENLRRQQQL